MGGAWPDSNAATIESDKITRNISPTGFIRVWRSCGRALRCATELARVLVGFPIRLAVAPPIEERKALLPPAKCDPQEPERERVFALE